MAFEDWSNAENDAIVADYFAMLADDLSGRPYNKADHNRTLQSVIGRGRGSIEFKHQNISAVLKGMGETWLLGYKPAVNFQRSLEDAVARWLQNRPDWNAILVRPPLAGVAERSEIWVGPPPTLSNAPPGPETEKLRSVAIRFDAAARDERNRVLGRAGEEATLHHERSALRKAGRDDLARKVEWVSHDRGDGLGYDIASFTPDGRKRLIEVKTTIGWERTPFHISANELAVAEDNAQHWCLFRLYNFAREPRAFELFPPLRRHVELTATSFRATPH
jgi:hypothetical protein